MHQLLMALVVVVVLMGLFIGFKSPAMYLGYVVIFLVAVFSLLPDNERSLGGRKR